MASKPRSAAKKAAPKKKGVTAATARAKKPAKAVAKRAPAKASAARSKAAPVKQAAPPMADPGKLSFNHAMIYVKDVQRSLQFYRELLGFKLIEDFRHQGISLYARLHAPGGDGTIALHLAGPGVSVASEGVRLYFEVSDVDDFCHRLQKRGFYLNQLPRMMPWGWRHAYLNDPDGHEISLYWAGENRMKKTVMQAARKAVSASR